MTQQANLKATTREPRLAAVGAVRDPSTLASIPDPVAPEAPAASFHVVNSIEPSDGFRKTFSFPRTPKSVMLGDLMIFEYKAGVPAYPFGYYYTRSGNTVTIAGSAPFPGTPVQAVWQG